ncbi:2-nitropropane dioxygenase [Mytilinidion resinicola]|uniref:2-nitropropane dioxygenase n=1 Tax=Mytilinidion resinicola TaxID=574789 RepID=A0A6A6YFC8_9PEZI|nr:2-nitropropane dioxygenase [Mytilinidion resinicola]KAF2807492.1 2-nitropropane dioxygenase [Mytilinidion resinicola]
MSISTPLTTLLGIQHPILLAGMGGVASPSLAAAVSNAGGMGVLGGISYTPAMLRDLIKETKSLMTDPSLPFGVDLLIPQVGGNARKTNYDYTKGSLSELIDVIIEGGAKLFVSAVGVPPKWVVEKLHKNGILYMNIIGHPKHIHKACAIGADLICAQGGEAGGHTGDIPFSVLIPACADVCKQYTSPLTSQPVQLVAAGGVNDGRSLAAALMFGASGVWVGTRFIPAKESGASEYAKKLVVDAGFDSVVKSTIWTGRPLRAARTPYIDDWETNRQQEIKELTAKGVLPAEYDLDKLSAAGKLTEEIEEQAAVKPMGIVAGLVNKKDQSAGEIVKDIVEEAVGLLRGASGFVKTASRL